LGVVLEPIALRASDYVTSVSEVQNSELAKRYAWLDTTRMAAIPIGGDPEDFLSLDGATCGTQESVHFEPGLIHLNYVGTYWPRVAPSIRALFQSFRCLRAADPRLGAKICLNFLGTNPGAGVPDFPVRRIAESECVADAVRELPTRLPYRVALGVLAKSHGLLLLGSDEPHYTASKIYPALMSGRPFISLFHRLGSSHAILSAAGGGRAFAFETIEQLDALAIPLADALRTLALDPQSFGKADPAAYAPFTAAAVSRRFAEIFDRLAAERRPN
jgi:hypothetical protein